MCTSPLSLYRPNRITNGYRLDVVPCGKCSECRAFKRAEIASKAVIESSRRSNLWLLTFTFCNDCVPLAVTPRLVSNDGELLHEYPSFISDIDRTDYLPQMIDSYRHSRFYSKKSPNGLLPISFKSCDIDEDHFIECRLTPSLDRRLWRLWLKRFRVQYERSYGKKLSDFKYLVFGEYGDLTARPHFHCMLSGLGDFEVNRLCMSWNYGHVDVRKVRRLNPDGSPGFVKSAKYISKYIGKDRLSLSHDLEGYVEKPRRLSSIGFGRLTSDEVSSYRSYYLPEPTLFLNGDNLLKEILNRRKTIFFDGQSLVMPRSVMRQIYYDSSYCLVSSPTKKNPNRFVDGEFIPSTNKIRVKEERALPLYRMARKFARMCYIEDFDNKLRQIISRNKGVSFCQVVSGFVDSLQYSLSCREEVAKTYYLNNLLSQKYA